MECNKDEAKRAMEIAERRVTDKDYNGAKKFANKAHNLYPPLDGLKQLLMMIDVYISGERKISGESDWYGILGVDPLAEDEVVKKQYRKLALMLHPDKNKCKGADGAFKLLSEAWSILSDKTTRFSYNIKRQVREAQQRSVVPPRPPTANGFQNARSVVPPRPPTANGFQNARSVVPPRPPTANGFQTARSEVPPRPPTANGFQTARSEVHPRPPTPYGFQNAREPVVPPHPPTANGFENARKPVVVSNAKTRTKPVARMDRSRMDSPASVPPIPKKSSTFWTMCDRCNTQYEYLKVYLNQTLLCPNCRVGFTAAERAPPASVQKPVKGSSNQQHWSSKTQATNKKADGTSIRRKPAPSGNRSSIWDSLSRTGDPNSQNGTNQAGNVAEQAQDKLKRGFGESQESDAARRFTNSDLKNFKKPRIDDSRMFGSFASQWSDQTGVGMGSRFSTPFNPANGNTQTPNTIGSRHPHFQKILLPRDLTKFLLKKAKSDILKRLPQMVSEMEEGVKAIERVKKSMKATSTRSDNEAERNSGSGPKDNRGNGIDVPDSDFHNFDLDRSENSFGDEQIWAAYDDDDGMPRYYARIQKVISVHPFKMRISWLNTKTCSEFSPLDWVGSGFAKSCGDFRIGKYESADALNVFSHRVNFTKGARGLLHILPRKGQVWALYRNWSAEWDKNTPAEVKHKYDMVEVLDYYTEDKPSLTVTLLVKAEGFKAVFRRSADENDVRMILKEEMFRFSHQIPHHVLTGKEADNAPEGCLELDPAATPCELLSEKAEAKESATMDHEKSEEKSTIPVEEVGMNLD